MTAWWQHLALSLLHPYPKHTNQSRPFTYSQNRYFFSIIAVRLKKPGNEKKNHSCVPTERGKKSELVCTSRRLSLTIKAKRFAGSRWVGMGSQWVWASSCTQTHTPLWYLSRSYPTEHVVYTNWHNIEMSEHYPSASGMDSQWFVMIWWVVCAIKSRQL